MRIPILIATAVFTEASGRGYFPGKLNGAEVTDKDSKRYADTGGWGCFNFNHHEPKAATAKVKPKAECAFCHMASAKKDDVWTQVLSAAGQVKSSTNVISSPTRGTVP